MNNPYTIKKELQDLNSRLPSEKKEIYSVPNGYFENLATSILAKIKTSERATPSEELESLSPLLASIPRKMPFAVPDNYFAQNINHLPGLAQDDDSLPAFLAQHHRQMPFEVPANYFENLPQQIINKAAKPTGAKVISFGRPTWMKYAAAAVITGMIALGTFFFRGNKAAIDPVKQPHEWVARTLQNVSNKDLEQFINTTDISINSQQIAKNKKSNSEVRQMLGNVSTNELDAFLKEMPSESDESLIN